MRRVINRRRAIGGLLLLLAMPLAPAFGQSADGHSTWKVVAASATMDDVDTSPDAPGERWASLAPRPIPPQPPVPNDRPPATPVTAAPRIARPVVQSLPPIDPRLDNRTRSALSFYGGAAARPMLQEMPRRTPVIFGSPRPALRQGKPFGTVMRDPTVTPYLNLDRDEDPQQLPNYFVFVRPQLEQQEANRRHQFEVQQLERQVQRVSTSVAGPQVRSAGLPNTGHAALFMDTAQFYGRWQR